MDKIDIRVGTIVTVEDVPSSDKLVRLKVDFGDRTRSILVGMNADKVAPVLALPEKPVPNGTRAG